MHAFERKWRVQIYDGQERGFSFMADQALFDKGMREGKRLLQKATARAITERQKDKAFKKWLRETLIGVRTALNTQAWKNDDAKTNEILYVCLFYLQKVALFGKLDWDYRICHTLDIQFTDQSESEQGPEWEGTPIITIRGLAEETPLELPLLDRFDMWGNRRAT